MSHLNLNLKWQRALYSYVSYTLFHHIKAAKFVVKPGLVMLD